MKERVEVEPVNYIKPKSVKETCEILAERGSLAKPFAGGTDLLVQCRKGTVKPEWLVDLKGLNLDTISPLMDGGISIGSLTTLNSILDSETIHNCYPVLCETAEAMASVQIRNRATIGGNICNASPSADMAAPLLALGARAVLVGVNGKREMGLEEFFLGPGKTDLHLGEILTEICIPPFPEKSGAVYLKQGRNAMDLALVGVAVVLSVNEHGVCEFSRIALGAVGPTPFFAKQASAELCQKKNDKSSVKKIAELAAEEAKPIDDVRASSWYRLSLIRTLTADAIEEAFRRANQAVRKNGR